MHVRHKRRLKPEDRSLDAHYGPFVVSQSLKGEAEAKRWALEVSYGRAPRPAEIAGRPGRVYELGPEVPPDDTDGRSAAVVVWHDGPLFYVVASAEWPVERLVKIAKSIY